MPKIALDPVDCISRQSVRVIAPPIMLGIKALTCLVKSIAHIELLQQTIIQQQMATEEGVDDISNVEEIDPNKLISKDGVLGFEKGSGFEQVTNFIFAFLGERN